MKLLVIPILLAIAAVVLHPKIDEGLWNKVGLILTAFGLLGVAYGDSLRGWAVVAVGVTMVVTGKHQWPSITNLFH